MVSIASQPDQILSLPILKELPFFLRTLVIVINESLEMIHFAKNSNGANFHEFSGMVIPKIFPDIDQLLIFIVLRQFLEKKLFYSFNLPFKERSISDKHQYAYTSFHFNETALLNVFSKTHWSLNRLFC